jgi:RNA polymerase sigma factor (sigma-70 family)
VRQTRRRGACALACGENRSVPRARTFQCAVATAVPLSRPPLPTPLLRLRSDEQLLALFRTGREDAFRAIHDRYHERLLAYVRHMLRGSSEAEDVVQDVFMRAYGALRSGDRDIAVRPWLYRVAHNRCIDYVRRAPATPLQPDELLPGGTDPVAEAERREELQRLVADLHNLPEQQRSALIIRELEGLSYADLAATIGVTVPAVKSLLVRARSGLADAAEARETDCRQIREELALAVDRPGRPPRLLRDHLRVCEGCRAHRQALKHGHVQLAGLLPGPSSLLLGGWLAALVGGGSGATSAAGGSAAIVAGATKTLAVASASVAVAGGAVEVEHRIAKPEPRPEARAAAKVVAATPAVRPPAPARRAAAKPEPKPVHMIDTTPAPVVAVPIEDADEEPTATPTPTPTETPEPAATPTPDATPTAEPSAEPTPSATAEMAVTPGQAP